MSPRCPRALELAWRGGCWELAGKRKWRVRGPGRAEVQEEGGVLSRDPGWRRLIPLWTRSWRWGLGSPWGEGSRTPSSAGQRSSSRNPSVLDRREEIGWSFWLEDETICGSLGLPRLGNRGGSENSAP